MRLGKYVQLNTLIHTKIEMKTQTTYSFIHCSNITSGVKKLQQFVYFRKKLGDLS